MYDSTSYSPMINKDMFTTVSSWSIANSTTARGTKDLCLTTQEISLVINIVAMCVGLFITFGNLLVLIVLFKYPAKHFTPFNWLLCHLAVADMAIGFTVFWWYGLAEILNIPVTSFTKVVSYSISIIAVLASFEGLMMIALDRYLLILKQRKYTSWLTRRRLIVAIIIMWLVPSLVELIAPISGWSCVDKCDCRIHNVAPDATYCFGEECSQILPPLTKHQLFVASVSSFMMFLVTLFLYICIFNGVRKQSNKMKQHLAAKRSKLNENQDQRVPFSLDTKNPVTRLSTQPSSPEHGSRKKNRPEWRHKLATVEERKSSELNGSIRFSTFSKDLDIPNDVHKLPTDNNSENETNIKEPMSGRDFSNAGKFVFPVRHFSCGDTPSPEEEPKKEMHRQDSKVSIATTTTELSYCQDSPSREFRQQNSFVRYNRGTDCNDNDETVVKNMNQEVIVKLRPKTKRTHQRQSSEDYRRSITQNVVKSFGRFALKGRRHSRKRTSASRKRDLRIMRSMFIIMAVFVLTTAPLMFFIIYTFANNDRSLKEIFNILLQVTTLNSFLNPILYFWRLPHMKKKFFRLVHAPYWEERWKLMTASCRKKPPIPMSKNVVEESEASWESAQSDTRE